MTNLPRQDAEGPQQQERGRWVGGRLTDEVLAILVHDLRSPLGAIQNGLAVMRLFPSANPDVEETLGIMERQVGQLAQLIGDLLDLARITTGKLALREEWLDLGQAVAHAVEACRPLLDLGGRGLTVSLPREPSRLRADRVRLQQILVNLLSNAAKYTDPGGHIWLTAEAEAGSLVLRVRDNGPGIAPELLARIFDLFQQAPETEERRRGGLGVGLALVRWLVELHGGSVAAFSDGPGKGSEFVVRLPCHGCDTRGPAPGRLPIKKMPRALAPPRAGVFAAG